MSCATRIPPELPAERIATPEWAVGYVYLLDTSDRYQKIGYSTDPYRRVNEFPFWPFAVWVAHCFPVFHKRVEAALHDWHEMMRVRGEWFELERKDIEWICSIKGVESVEELERLKQKCPAQGAVVKRKPLIDTHRERLRYAVARRWQKICRDRGLSFREMCRRAGIHYIEFHRLATFRCAWSWIDNEYEIGDGELDQGMKRLEMSWFEVIRLCRVMGITPNDLFLESDD
jgi:hypothetical protein